MRFKRIAQGLLATVLVVAGLSVANTPTAVAEAEQASTSCKVATSSTVSKGYKISATRSWGLKLYKSWKPKKDGSYAIAYFMKQGDVGCVVGKKVVKQGASVYTWLHVKNWQKKSGWFIKRAGAYKKL